MSSFFTLPTSQRKRKRPDPADSSASKSAKRSTTAREKPRKKQPRDESVSGSEDDNLSGAEISSQAGSDASSDHENETAAERRLRLAERYLENLQQDAEEEVGFDAAEVDKQYIAERLKEDAAESKGKVYRYVASELDWAKAQATSFRADQKALTGVAMHGKWIWTTAKDRSMAMWELPENSAEEPAEESPAVNGNEGQEQGKQPNGVEKRGAKTHPRRKPYLRSLKRPSPRQSKKSRKPKYRNVSAEDLGAILSVAVSPSGHLIATGHDTHQIAVWTTGIAPTNSDSSPSTPALSLHKVLTHTHRSPVTSLAFRLTPPRRTTATTSYSGTNTLYSGSADRTLKVWSLDTMSYVESLFGHQDSIQDINALRPEICVSVGGRDRTVRYWRVSEEKMLVFRGGGSAAAFPTARDAISDAPQEASTKDATHVRKEPAWKRNDDRGKYTEGSIDRVAMLSDSYFVSGSDNGALCLWHTSKKKPLHTIPLAHGRDLPPPVDNEDDAADASLVELGLLPGHADEPSFTRRDDMPHTPRWITALAALPYSDLVVSGSWDGVVRIWKLSADKRRLEPAGVLGSSDEAKDVEREGESEGILKGIVTDIKVAPKDNDPRLKQGLRIAVATSKEHRLGRWHSKGMLETSKGRNQAWVFDIGRIARGKDEDDGIIEDDDE